MANLTIIVKTIYFNEILAGKKTREYRAFSDFWLNRLVGSWHSLPGDQIFIDENSIKVFDTVTFQKGYTKDQLIKTFVKTNVLDDCFEIEFK